MQMPWLSNKRTKSVLQAPNVQQDCKKKQSTIRMVYNRKYTQKSTQKCCVFLKRGLNAPHSYSSNPNLQSQKAHSVWLLMHDA